MSDEQRSKKVPPELADLIREELLQLDGHAFTIGCFTPVAFSVLVAIQCGVRHPNCNGKVRLFAIEYARNIQAWLSDPERPNLSKMLDEGWHEEGPSDALVLH